MFTDSTTTYSCNTLVAGLILQSTPIDRWCLYWIHGDMDPSIYTGTSNKNGIREMEKWYSCNLPQNHFHLGPIHQWSSSLGDQQVRLLLMSINQHTRRRE